MSSTHASVTLSRTRRCHTVIDNSSKANSSLNVSDSITSSLTVEPEILLYDSDDSEAMCFLAAFPLAIGNEFAASVLCLVSEFWCAEIAHGKVS